jgi:hypothetical protein
MSETHAPASYRGSQTAGAFLREVGNVWIGLLETAEDAQDRIDPLADYFNVAPGVIRNWIDSRGRMRCVASLPDGRRCAVLVGQHVEYDPNAWAKHERKCVKHCR